MKDATTLTSPAGNGSSEYNQYGTLWTQGSFIGHCALVPRMGWWTQNIELGPGPAQASNTTSAIHTLNEFAQQRLPWTQTVEALSQTFHPEEHSKYTAVYETIYNGKADNVDEEFGIWTTCWLVINANTNDHKDLEDLCHLWCATVVFGDFEGGDACFPQLGVQIDCTPGM